MTVDAVTAAPPTRTTAFPRPVLGRVTALWCAGFALTHGYWALGGRAGVDAGVPDIATRPVFLAYDVVAGLLLLGGAVFAVVVAAGRVPAVSVPLARRVAGAVAVLLAVRGLVGVLQDALTLASGDALGVGAVYDAWFLVAAVLFAGLALRVRR